MPVASAHRRKTVLRMAFAALVIAVAAETAAEVLALTSSDGVPIETNRLTPSTRFVGAAAVWVYNSYPMSIECNPPRACYAKSQAINYHFSCGPRYIVVAERISMDLNGNVVNHQVLQPGATSGLNNASDIDMLDMFCGPLPDLSDLLEQRREALERSRSEKPPKGK